MSSKQDVLVTTKSIVSIVGANVFLLCSIFCSSNCVNL